MITSVFEYASEKNDNEMTVQLSGGNYVNNRNNYIYGGDI